MSRARISRLFSSCVFSSCTCSRAHSLVSTFFPTQGMEGNQEKSGNRCDGRSSLGTSSSMRKLVAASGSLGGEKLFSLLPFFAIFFCFWLFRLTALLRRD